MFSYLQKTLFGADEQIRETSEPTTAETTTEESTILARETTESAAPTINETLINSFDSTDDILNKMAEQQNQLEQPDNSHFLVGEDTEDGDDFVQEPPPSNNKSASYIMELGEKRKRLRYVCFYYLWNSYNNNSSSFILQSPLTD